MKKQILLALAAAATIFSAAQSTYAFTEVCTLANTEVPGSIRVASTDLAAYKEKLKTECELSEKYQQMVLKARKFGISLEQVSEYQALRYINRFHFNSAYSRNRPVPLIYQVAPSEDELEESLRSSVVWDNFQLGVKQLEVERARIAAGGKFQLADLLRIHRGFYQLSLEVDPNSRRANPPNPGVMKPATPNDRPWWTIAPDQVATTKAIVDDMNRVFALYGLLPNNELQTLFRRGNETVIHSVRQNEEGGWSVYGADSRVFSAHMERLFANLNKGIDQARAGQHMVWNERLVTPGEAALLLQQMFVAIHPMADGNGRVSRFLQELVLTLFSMPHGSSGDFMDNDVLTPQGEYYNLAMTKTRALLASVDGCFEKAYSGEAFSKGAGGQRSSKGQSSTKVAEPVNAAALDQSNIVYNCRVLSR